MSAPHYFSYIRVSTARQGQNGTSLEEQRAAITRYAARFELPIRQEFEEKETAAKQGRPIFLQMLKGLRQGRARGVIMHKIDRSARNLKDWAELGELIDKGIEVHFANEQLDLYSRGGRLSADIQAVVAADYIRNLREEVKKGFYGRLKQGLYPMPAPIGYRDCGQGHPKEPDPVQAPLVRQTFALYATGQWGHIPLAKEMYRRGLRNRAGGPVNRNSIADLLHNPFYMGLIRLKASGEYYKGIHPPLIPKSLFDQVQNVAAGKCVREKQQHWFLYRKLLSCAECQNSLIPERQKGHVYYRCQTRECSQKTVREEFITAQIKELLRRMQFSEEERVFIKQYLQSLEAKQQHVQITRRKTLALQLEQLQNRLSRLTDAFLEDSIEKDLYLRKKNNLLLEEQVAQERLRELEAKKEGLAQQATEFLELVNRAYLSYELGTDEEKLEMVKIVFSNLEVSGKMLIPKPHFPFALALQRADAWDGGPSRALPRTFHETLNALVQYFAHTLAPERESLMGKNF